MNLQDFHANARRALSISSRLYDKELFGYAASLSFYTLLAIFPILMVSFGIFMQMESFQTYAEYIKHFLLTNFLPIHQDVISQYFEQFLTNSMGLNITGLIAVLFSSLMFFKNFEYIVCKLSNSEKRRFFNNLSTYWTLMTLSPLGLGGALYISGLLQNSLHWNYISDILPYLIVWAIFAVTYAVAINRKIAFSAVLIASFLSSIGWWIVKILFVAYVSYNKTYTNIYGSFSIMFFFFLWIDISWILFLHGVKLCVLLDKVKWRNSSNKNSE